MYLRNNHEYNNIIEVKFGKYKRILGKDDWYADIVMVLEDGTLHEVRWGLDRIEVIADLMLRNKVEEGEFVWDTK